jgi:carbamoyl-phosphate synthase large subunit
VVSSADICEIFESKKLAQDWFLAHNVNIPIWKPEVSFPWIAKHIHGFGSRRQFIIENMEDYTRLCSKVNLDEYLLQPFINGPEYTVDAYVSRDGKILGIVTRRRIKAIDGEAVCSVTKKLPKLSAEVCRILNYGGFMGPITFQAIEHENKYFFLEVNNRFGGGVILSMEAGADYAQLLVREALGLPVQPVEWREGLMMMRAYREVFMEVPVNDNNS